MFNFPSVSQVCSTSACRPTVYVVARSTYIVMAGRCVFSPGDPSSITHVSYTQFATHITFYFNNVCILQGKKLSIYATVVFSTQEQQGLWENHPHHISLNPIIMVAQCDATAAWLWRESANTTLAVASLEGGGQGWSGRILFNYVNQLRIKLISKLNVLFIFLIYCLLVATKTMHNTPP